MFARSPLSLPQIPFSRSLRSTICNPGSPHPMRTLRITNGGPERAKNGVWGRERGDRANIEFLKQCQSPRPIFNNFSKNFVFYFKLETAKAFSLLKSVEIDVIK